MKVVGESPTFITEPPPSTLVGEQQKIGESLSEPEIKESTASSPAENQSNFETEEQPEDSSNHESLDHLADVIIMAQRRKRKRPAPTSAREHGFHRALAAYHRRADEEAEVANRGVLIDKYF